MKIAVLGTGIVGRTLAGGLSDRGHAVTMGTRDVAETLARSETDAMGNQPFAQWHAGHSNVQLVAFDEATPTADLVINATSGQASLAALEAGASGLDDKVLVDVANPLDFSHGMPPTLSVANTDSLAEQIQQKFPRSKVVKALNTMNARLMVEPSRLPESHNVFIAGDDDAAKKTVRDLLQELGWKDENIVDVGGIQAARGLEMYLPLWLSLMGKLGTPDFNIRLVRA
ncbi:MAG: 8-hydroxy-5-deazaflavin:NADPH oxidoreductase [Actinomycetota bacterium]|jgi:predicted dinucleotide-binding enzyme|nr:8-hydroxy-5-deazaflavin:NADPH oxidoreductase [Actinomycetota bacterium]